MPQIPKEPKRGDPLEADWGQAVIRFLRSLVPSSSGDISINSSDSGWTATLKKRVIASEASDPDHPWKPYKPIDASSGLAIKLIPGTIGNELATNWNGEIVLSANAESKWVYLETNIDQDGTVVSAEIKTADVPPTPESPSADGTIPTTLYTGLFAYDSNETAPTHYYQAQDENLKVEIDVTQPGCADITRRVTVVSG